MQQVDSILEKRLWLVESLGEQDTRFLLIAGFRANVIKIRTPYSNNVGSKTGH